MSNVRIFIGGTPNPLYPNFDGRNEFREPHAKRIAYDYATGEFTLGHPLKPSEIIYQRRALECADLAVGDMIMMYVIPEKHLLRGVLAEVSDIDTRFAGATLKPSAMLWDSEKHTYEELDVLDSLFDNLALDESSVTYSDLKASSLTLPALKVVQKGEVAATTETVKVTTNGGYFVAPGYALVLGFKVTALPTDSTLNFGLTKATIALTSKVSGFDIPTCV